jgi:hypothetical protein
MTHRAFVAAMLLTAVSACRAPAEPSESETFNAQESHLEEGTPEAIGVLAFLSSEGATLSVLDNDVPLDSRAAENIIDFRDGADGILGNGDDKVFRTIAELDAVKWVGPASIARLRTYAQTHDWVPQDDDVLGVYEGVSFTVAEAEATLELANSAHHALLDEDVGLDSRAADGILAAKPIATMLELSEAYYVGHSAMLKLKAFPTALPSGLANGEACEAADDCASGLCVGETLGDGMCDDESMADDFTWDEMDEIPDGDPNGLVLSMNIQGLASVPVDVVLSFDVIHPNKEDLVVILHQPGGGSEVIWNHEANPPTVVSAGWGIERDNMVNGVWSVEVIDTVAGNAGEFWGANLYLSSRWD